MTGGSTSSSVPRELQVYVLSHIRDDSTVENDRNPRQFSPTKVGEYLDLPPRVRSRVKNPLPELLQSAREGKPIEMKGLQPPYPGAPDADYCAWASYNFHIFSRRAAVALHDLLSPAGTFLPLACREADLVGYLVDAVDDLLDMDASTINWTVSGKKKWISSIDRYAFHTEKLGKAAIFRDPVDREVFVLQPFVDVVRSHPFTGFNFCRVWPAGEKRWWHHEPWI